MKRVHAFLDRQEQCVASRLGAGRPLEHALGLRRWAREAQDDLHLTPDAAQRSVQAIRQMLVPACEYPIARERALAVHFVYGEIRSAWRALDAQIPPPAEGSQLVYFLRDESGVLLYVGITGRGPVRLVEHYRTKDWFTRVARVDFERYDTRPEAERREVQAIKTLGPRYNVVHNTSGAR